MRTDQADGLREWDYYAVFTPDFAIGLTLADLGLLSFGILTLEDYETGKIHSAHFIAEADALDFPPTPLENKRVSMPATGSVLVGETTYSLPEGSSFGVLDWGRGAWPENVRSEWGHFAGIVDGRMVGINLGTVNGDDTPGTADAVIVDGALDLTLTPDFDDSTTLSLGAAYTLTRWKVHGEIVGSVQLADGPRLDVHGTRGAAEYVEIIW